MCASRVLRIFEHSYHEDEGEVEEEREGQGDVKVAQENDNGCCQNLRFDPSSSGFGGNHSVIHEVLGNVVFFFLGHPRGRRVPWRVDGMEAIGPRAPQEGFTAQFSRADAVAGEEAMVNLGRAFCQAAIYCYTTVPGPPESEQGALMQEVVPCFSEAAAAASEVEVVAIPPSEAKALVGAAE